MLNSSRLILTQSPLLDHVGGCTPHRAKALTSRWRSDNCSSIQEGRCHMMLGKGWGTGRPRQTSLLDGLRKSSQKSIPTTQR